MANKNHNGVWDKINKEVGKFVGNQAADKIFYPKEMGEQRTSRYDNRQRKKKELTNQMLKKNKSEYSR